MIQRDCMNYVHTRIFLIKHYLNVTKQKSVTCVPYSVFDGIIVGFYSKCGQSFREPVINTKEMCELRSDAVAVYDLQSGV